MLETKPAIRYHKIRKQGVQIKKTTRICSLSGSSCAVWRRDKEKEKIKEDAELEKDDAFEKDTEVEMNDLESRRGVKEQMIIEWLQASRDE